MEDMKMYKCNSCGEEFSPDDAEQETFIEYHGTSVVSDICPHCGSSNIEEMYECKVCGNLFTDSDLTDYVCDNCISENATLENAIKFGNDTKVHVQINSFYREIFDERMINSIIGIFVKKAKVGWDIDKAEKFCLEDKSEFAEWLRNREEDNGRKKILLDKIKR